MESPFESSSVSLSKRLSKKEFATYMPTFIAQIAVLEGLNPEARAKLNLCQTLDALLEVSKTDLHKLKTSELRVFLDEGGMEIIQGVLAGVDKMLSSVDQQSASTSGQVAAAIGGSTSTFRYLIKKVEK